MSVDGPRFPTRLLRRSVEAACGPASELGVVGYQFAEWVEGGPALPRATTAAVEPQIAGYLHAASRAGRRWGIMAGFALVSLAATLVAVGLVARAVLT